MKPFVLTPKMLTLQGVFYPTGYAVLLFPDEATAAQAGRELQAAGFREEDMMALTPQAILTEIGQLQDPSEEVMPSVGTEGETVNQYIALARDGHHGVMLKAPSDAATERIMSAVKHLPLSYGQKYHMLAIEDLE
ncbi:MAG: RNA-binding protein [Pseudomonadota bacterium]|nr:RNA-binding protein [Pseudomonadota bacterium]